MYGNKIDEKNMEILPMKIFTQLTADLGQIH